MTDEMLMYAALLALTRQNVLSQGTGGSAAIMGDAIIYAEGWVNRTPYIIGPIGGPTSE